MFQKNHAPQIAASSEKNIKDLIILNSQTGFHLISSNKNYRLTREIYQNTEITED